MTGPNRVFFRVLTDSGKNYRILIAESDLPVLRVSSIKKNMAATASIPIPEQHLYYHGRELSDYETGADIGLSAESQLIMRRSAPAAPPQTQTSPRYLVPDRAQSASVAMSISPTMRSVTPGEPGPALDAARRAIDGERAALEATRVDLARRWETEQRKWGSARQELVDRYEQQLADLRRMYGESTRRLEEETRLRAAQTESQQAADQSLRAEVTDWRGEKEQILTAWGRETERLSAVFKKERRAWETARAELESKLANEHQRADGATADAEVALEAERAALEDEARALREESMGLARRLRDAEYDLSARDDTIAALREGLPQGTDATRIELAAQVRRLTEEHGLTVARLKREMTARRRLHNTLEDLRGGIRVVVRARPRLPSDQAGHARSLHPDAALITEGDRLEVRLSRHEARHYDFYRVLGPEATQDDVYSEVHPLVRSTIDGYNLCIISYGQTGSGKTYTIFGDNGCEGVIQRAVRTLFSHLGDLQAAGAVATVSVSLVELYLDKLTDMLPGGGRRAALQIRQGRDGQPRVNGLGWHPVTSAGEALGLMARGLEGRRTAATAMNEVSSRSHTVLTLKLAVTDDEGLHSTAMLTFADLAGSERIQKSLSEGDRLREAQSINSSLAALGDVVASLCGKRSHIPYRNSKLTQLLQPSLGGNSKTLLFANVSGAGQHVQETQSTLSFASKVKTVRNVAIRNIRSDG